MKLMLSIGMVAVAACATPAILTPEPSGGACHTGDQLQTLCRDRVTCCPGGYHCAADGHGCEMDTVGPTPDLPKRSEDAGVGR